MKFGASVWPWRWDAPYDKAVERIGNAGFRAVEFIAWDDASFDDSVSGSRRNEPAPTDPKPTGRSNASTALSEADGHTDVSTVQTPNAAKPWPPGRTTTITTGSTQQSETSPSAA